MKRIFSIGLFLFSSIFADVIHLKSGEKIQGVSIIEMDSDNVKYKIGDDVNTIKRANVEAILSDDNAKIAKKGKYDWYVSLPFANAMLMQTGDFGTKTSSGTLGFGFGFDRHRLDNSFIDFSISSVFTGDILSGHISISNNNKIGDFTLGYGFSYAGMYWDECVEIDGCPTRSHSTLGLIFPAYYQISDWFSVGLIYRPNFYRVNTFAYEHLISLEFAFGKGRWD